MTQARCRSISLSSTPARVVERAHLWNSARGLAAHWVAVTSLLLITYSSAWASCCGPSEPDPVTEMAAKAAVAGGVIAFVGYRYYKRRSPRG